MVDPTEAVKAWYSNIQNWKSHLPDHFDEGLVYVDKMVVGKGVLNLGCFYPVTEQRFASLATHWCAIDICPAVIKRCNKQFPELANVSFRVADMTSLPYLDKTFDTVFDFSSGDHLTIENYIITIKEVNRVLVDNGYFIVSYANLDHFKDGIRDMFGDYGYERRTPSSELKRYLNEGGFTILRNENKSTRSGFVCQKIRSV